jgi:chorismate mutase
MTTIDDIRAIIDQMDEACVRLLAERFHLAVATARLKPEIQDAVREEEVLRHVETLIADTPNPQFYRDLFARILAESKRLQEEEVQK